MYDFDDHPDRRKFLDQLLRFMEEKGSPITACPTISKNPLDLFRLYLLVRERGGFLEVTKNKSWKDIAQTLGIGASSSAAYTLRKHYTKNLFPWECKFDRGGVDPQPILNQVKLLLNKTHSAICFDNFFFLNGIGRSLNEKEDACEQGYQCAFTGRIVQQSGFVSIIRCATNANDGWIF